MSSYDSVNIRKSMTAFDTAAQFDGYSKVVLIVSDEIQYSAGTDTGRTLTVTCPWGNQTIADNILKSINGFQYQPLTAEGALVDPAAEIGDGITANGVYSGIYSMDLQFDSLLPAKVSAPADEELYEEHTYIPKTDRIILRKFLSVDTQLRIHDGEIAAEVAAREASDREFRSALEITSSRISAEVSARENADNQLRATLNIQAGQIQAEVEARTNGDNQLRATLDIQAGQISAKVSKSGGDPRSFGWDLLDSSMVWYSSGTETARLDSSGAKIRGRIEALSGKIGGFDIGQDSLSYNGQTWGGTNTWGCYIGSSGIQLGKNFKVDMAGNLTASSATLGSIYVSNGETSGTYYGGLSGCGGSVSGLSGSISGMSGSVSGLSGSLSTGINVGNVGIGTYVGNIVADRIDADYINARLATLEFVNCRGLNNMGHIYSPMTIFYKGTDGKNKSAKVFGYV